MGSGLLFLSIHGGGDGVGLDACWVSVFNE
jgi:hypothetical protein